MAGGGYGREKSGRALADKDLIIFKIFLQPIFCKINLF